MSTLLFIHIVSMLLSISLLISTCISIITARQYAMRFGIATVVSTSLGTVSGLVLSLTHGLSPVCISLLAYEVVVLIGFFVIRQAIKSKKLTLSQQ